MTTLGKTIGAIFLLAAAGGCIAGGIALGNMANEGKIKIPFINDSSSSGAAVPVESANSTNADDNDISTTIRASGVSVKMLSDGVNTYGQKTKTFSYEVTPSNATNQDVNATLSWSNSSVSSQLSNYLTASINKNNKTITITAKQDFGNQATLTVESAENASKYATVTIDCVQKHLGWKTAANAPAYTPQFTFSSGSFRSNWGHSVSSEYVSYSPSNSTRGPWDVSDFDLGDSTVYSVPKTITKDMWIGLSQNNKRNCKLVVFGVNGAPGYYYDGDEVTNNSILNADNQYTYDFGVENILPDEIDADELDYYEDDIRSRIQERISNLSSATKSELARLKSSNSANFFYMFGMKIPCSLNCTASTGATATYSSTTFILEDMSRFTF